MKSSQKIVGMKSYTSGTLKLIFGMKILMVIGLTSGLGYAQEGATKYTFKSLENENSTGLNIVQSILNLKQQVTSPLQSLEKNCPSKITLIAQEDSPAVAKKHIHFSEPVSVLEFDKEEGKKHHFAQIKNKEGLYQWSLSEHLPVNERKSKTNPSSIDEKFQKAQLGIYDFLASEGDMIDLIHQEEALTEEQETNIYNYIVHAHKTVKKYNIIAGLILANQKNSAEDKKMLQLSHNLYIQVSSKLKNLQLQFIKKSQNAESLAKMKNLAFKSAYRLYYFNKISRSEFDDYLRQIELALESKPTEVAEDVKD